METKRFFNFNQFDATDLVALVTIIGGMLLMALKIDTVVGGLLTLVAAYYFGRKNARNDA